MHIVRYVDAPAYDAPGHEGMAMRRLQGREAGPADTAWIGMSRVAPGGGTTLGASDVEKFYVCLQGEVEVTTQLGDTTETTRLGLLDSCRIAPFESRRIFNPGGAEAWLLLVMPLTQPLKS